MKTSHGAIKPVGGVTLPCRTLPMILQYSVMSTRSAVRCGHSTGRMSAHTTPALSEELCLTAGVSSQWAWQKSWTCCLLRKAAFPGAIILNAINRAQYAFSSHSMTGEGFCSERKILVSNGMRHVSFYQTFSSRIQVLTLTENAVYRLLHSVSMSRTLTLKWYPIFVLMTLRSREKGRYPSHSWNPRWINFLNGGRSFPKNIIVSVKVSDSQGNSGMSHLLPFQASPVKSTVSPTFPPTSFQALMPPILENRRQKRLLHSRSQERVPVYGRCRR